MDPIRQSITQQLRSCGYTDFEIVKIEKTPLALDGKGNPFYEKWRLLVIFRRRLKGCLLYDKENEMIPFLKDAISTLENIPDESEIYVWITVVNGKHVHGRSTK